MATIVRCDHCNKRLTTEAQDINQGVSIRAKTGLVQQPNYDLCDTCVTELEQWILPDEGQVPA